MVQAEAAGPTGAAVDAEEQEGLEEEEDFKSSMMTLFSSRISTLGRELTLATQPVCLGSGDHFIWSPVAEQTGMDYSIKGRNPM